jgi:hypothetical protein
MLQNRNMMLRRTRLADARRVPRNAAACIAIESAFVWTGGRRIAARAMRTSPINAIRSAQRVGLDALRGLRQWPVSGCIAAVGNSTPSFRFGS